MSEPNSRKPECCDSSDDSTTSDISTVFCRSTALEHLSISPRGCTDLHRLYVSISKLCPDLSSIGFEDELFSYFLVINSLFEPALARFREITFGSISPGVAAPQAAELIDWFTAKL